MPMGHPNITKEAQYGMTKEEYSRRDQLVRHKKASWWVKRYDLEQAWELAGLD